MWLGTKQALMIAVLIIFASVIPPFYRYTALVKSLPEDAQTLPTETAHIFQRLEKWVITMRVMGALAVVLAVFKPGLQ